MWSFYSNEKRWITENFTKYLYNEDHIDMKNIVFLFKKNYNKKNTKQRK